MNKNDIRLIGASRGEYVGLTVPGFAEGFEIDFDKLRAFTKRRSPSDGVWSTSRREPDEPEFLSGVTDGKLDGNELTVRIKNRDVGACEENVRADVPRPGHADLAAILKYGKNVDLRGGGAFSGRMTAPVCVLGGIVIQILESKGIYIRSHVYSIAGIRDKAYTGVSENLADYETQDGFPTLDANAGEAMKAAIARAADASDSVGGVTEVAIIGLPAGIGGGYADGLDVALAGCVFAVPAVKGFEIGNGFEAAEIYGSRNNDAIVLRDGRAVTETNNAGGILGGISDGMPVIFRAAVKPTPSVAKPQKTVSFSRGEAVTLEIKGRNDACIVPRVLPVLETAAALAVFEKL